MTLRTDMITDLAVFFNTSEFAVDAVYTPAPSASSTTPVVITNIAVGYPTILTSALHGLVDGDSVTLDDFAGLDADLLNGEVVTVAYATDNTFAVAINTTGKTITDNTNTATATPVPLAAPVPVTIQVIFNKEYDPMSGVGGYRYYCLAKTADVSAAVPEETLEIDGIVYKIKGPPQHTGDGISEIELSID